MTEDGLFVCDHAVVNEERGGRMRDEDEKGTVVELLLREPEIVAWLDDYRAAPGSRGQALDFRPLHPRRERQGPAPAYPKVDEDDEPPRAA
jgi:hypothetical protein